MFRRVAPHTIRHADGSVVQIVSRYTVEYLENGRRAKLAADFGDDPVTVKRDSLSGWQTDSGEYPMETSERDAVWEKIAAALECLGENVKIC